MFKKHVFPIFYLFLLSSGLLQQVCAAIQVFYRDETVTSHENNLCKPRIYLKNTGTQSVTNITVYYYFTASHTVIIEDYNGGTGTPNSAPSVQDLGSTNQYLKFDFGSYVLPGNNAQSPEEMVGLHYDDWATWNKTNDYSFDSTHTSLTLTTKIVVMVNGQIVSGTFPSYMELYSLNVTPSGSGTVTKVQQKTLYALGELVTITPTASTGYTFSSWSGGASGSANPLAVTVSGNMNITANFSQIVNPKYPPVITNEPANQSVLEGNPCSFSLEATGLQPFTYQWRKNGSNVGINSASYSISSTPSSDSGAVFDCIVTNIDGRDTSRQAVLSVLIRPEPPYIIKQPEAVVVTEGDTAVFRIGAAGTRPIAYQWYCNTSALTGAVDSILRVIHVTLNDNGKKYHCQVTNVASSVISDDALLTVKRPSSHTLIITGDLLTSSYTKVGVSSEARMNFVVRLYPSALSDSVVYTESFLDTNNQAIKVKDGRFAIQLGAGQTTDDLMSVVRTHANIFVSFTISRPGGNEETLDRRVPLTASPYALSSLPHLLKGNVNPDSAAIDAPIGTHYVRTTSNATFVKTFRGWVELK